MPRKFLYGHLKNWPKFAEQGKSKGKYSGWLLEVFKGLYFDLKRFSPTSREGFSLREKGCHLKLKSWSVRRS